MKKRLLILNGNDKDIPLIKAGKALGYHVITTGNQPDLIGHQYADEYICGDYSDYKAITELAKKAEIDAVCACANDFGAITAAYVAEKLGLPGHDSFEKTLTLHHKDKFKEMAKKIDLRTPRSQGFDNEAEAISYALEISSKIIVKPVDLAGGRGISTAATPEEKIVAIREAFSNSREKRVVVEEFVQGTHHSFATFIVDQKVVCAFSDDEFFFGPPYAVSTSAAPATGIEKVQKILVDEMEKVAAHLNLVDGRLHIQYIVDELGNPYIIEMTRRCSGIFYPYLSTRALGINTAEWIVKAECGLDCKNHPRGIEQTRFVGRHILFAPRNGRIKKIRISENLDQHIYDRMLYWGDGSIVHDYLSEHGGFIFYDFPSEKEMREIIGDITNHITFEFYE